MSLFRKLLFAAVLSVVVSLSTAPAVRADAVVFSNFGPGMSFNPSFSYGGVLAVRFTSAADFTFTSAQLAVSGDPGQVQVALAINSGNAPGTILETITLNVVTGLVTANSTLNPTLSAGTDYWLLASLPGFSLGWNATTFLDNNNNNFVAGPFGPSLTGPWDTLISPTIRPAFQINGNPAAAAVPEPATLIMLGTGFAGMCAALRKRKKRRA